MDADAIEVLGKSLRLIVVTATNLTMSTFIISILLEKKRSLWPLISYKAGKVLYYNILVSCVLDHYFGREYWLQCLTLFSICAFAILTYVVFCYTFKGGLLKVAIAAMIAELIAVFFGYFSIAAANLIEGKADIWNLVAAFQPADLLIPVIAATLFCFFYHFAAPFLRRFRDYELRHKRVLWVLFVCHVGLGSLTTILSYESLVVGGALAGLISCVIAAGVGYLTMGHYRRLQYRQSFQRMQQKVMEAYYETVQGQIHAMEQNQSRINAQMAEIDRMGAYAPEGERIASYLADLKQNYEEIRAGIYCDDWMVDAVLYSQAALLQKQGVRFECSMQQGDMRGIEEQDFIQILLLLLNLGTELNREIKAPDEKRVQLRTAAVKNQLVIDFFSTYTGKCRISKSGIRAYLRKYHGQMSVEKGADRVDIRLTLQSK